MVTVDKIDLLLKQASEDQAQDLGQIQDAESFELKGIELNAASRPVTIYQKETGDPRTMPMLVAQIALKKRYRGAHPLRGQFVFSATPTKEYHPGQVKCTLHPDNPKRSEFDVWGLPVCTSAHLASPGEERLHMKKRHPSAANIIKEEVQEERRLTELESSNALAESVRDALVSMSNQGDMPRGGLRDSTIPTRSEPVTLGTSEAPLYVSDKPDKKRRKSRK